MAEPTRKRKRSHSDEGSIDIQMKELHINPQGDDDELKLDGQETNDNTNNTPNDGDDYDELELITELMEGLTTFEDDGDQDTANPTNVTLRIRICCNNKYATLPFTVPAEYAAEMGGLVDIVESKLPVTFASCYNEDIRSSPMQVLAEPVILMQETSYKSRRLRFSKWITAAYPNDLQCYEEWYERNVENGEEPELLMEIRIRTDGSTEPYRLIKGAGKGFFKLGMHLFHPLMVEPQTEAEECMIWNDLCRREALCFVDLTETNTDNYFPERRHRRPNVGRAVQQINGSWTIVYD